MIYSPAHYREERNELIYQIIEDYSFATVITESLDGPFVSHLPLLLDHSESGLALLGHCAKANPQWKHFADGKTLTVIFHGPHSYISPAWYEPRPDNVPTWNYAAVHVQGTASVLSDDDEVYEILKKTVHKFENTYETGWSLPAAANEDLVKLLRHIVAFRIEIKDIKAKFKLSQGKYSPNRENVVQNLSEMGEAQQQLARLMRDVQIPAGK